MAKLFDHEDECDAHMLKSAGVYAVLDEDNEVLYIGQTDCFIKRWGFHCKGEAGCPSKDIFKFVVLSYEDSREERLRLEAEYTLQYRPKYGRAGSNVFERASNYKLNPYKRRKLNELGLQSAWDPYPPVEDPEEALDSELRFLRGIRDDL